MWKFWWQMNFPSYSFKTDFSMVFLLIHMNIKARISLNCCILAIHFWIFKIYFRKIYFTKLFLKSLLHLGACVIFIVSFSNPAIGCQKHSSIIKIIIIKCFWQTCIVIWLSSFLSNNQNMYRMNFYEIFCDTWQP